MLHPPNDDYVYVDDHLTEDEIDLICGVYHVHTDDNQTSLSSWWPRSNIWDIGGMNLGVWTPDNEEWYLARLAKLTHGEEGLKTSADWRNHVKRMKKTWRLRETLSQWRGSLRDHMQYLRRRSYTINVFLRTITVTALEAVPCI
ncbi:hypothetical protein HGRIS_008942 [Hohenbuehelia grisea]|uniref:Uncharacterized protein n=1 Tax=Hohenbuehelia grisea TaxID=104357 RepID=A0ABR3IZK6_9AGAR